MCVCDHSSARSGEVCVSAYISENAPVYGDVSVHMLEWAPRRITAICGCLCVRVGVLDGERQKEFAHMQGHMYINYKSAIIHCKSVCVKTCMRVCAPVAMSLTAAAVIGSDRAVSVSHSR